MPNEPINETNNQTSKGHGEVILLVDDEPMVLEMGSDVLESLGYHVLLASNGLEAVEIFKANQDNIALVITDIVMPKLGGIEAVKRIRKIQPNAKVIFSTGYDPDSTLTQTIIANHDPVLNKPYQVNDLSTLITQQLKSKS